MNNKASLTALMSAYARAYVSQNNINPIFNDSLARELLTDEEYNMIGGYILDGISFFTSKTKANFRGDGEALKYIVETQFAPTPLARTRFCEDSLKVSVLTGTEQYVILGAGLDTFSLRERTLMKRLAVFEVDHPLTQEDKIKRIKRAGFAIPENLYFVPCDFSKDNFSEKLISAGFDINKKTFFSWLGVSYYLYREEIEKFIENLSSVAADGSSLVFDYADSGLFLSDVGRVKNMIAMAKKSGEEMKSSFDCLSMENLLSKYGFLTYEHLDTKEIQRRYFGGRSDNLSAFENINYALAVIKK